VFRIQRFRGADRDRAAEHVGALPRLFIQREFRKQDALPHLVAACELFDVRCRWNGEHRTLVVYATRTATRIEQTLGCAAASGAGLAFAIACRRPEFAALRKS